MTQRIVRRIARRQNSPKITMLHYSYRFAPSKEVLTLPRILILTVAWRTLATGLGWRTLGTADDPQDRGLPPNPRMLDDESVGHTRRSSGPGQSYRSHNRLGRGRTAPRTHRCANGPASGSRAGPLLRRRIPPSRVARFEWHAAHRRRGPRLSCRYRARQTREAHRSLLRFTALRATHGEYVRHHADGAPREHARFHRRMDGLAGEVLPREQAVERHGPRNHRGQRR